MYYWKKAQFPALSDTVELLFPSSVSVMNNFSPYNGQYFLPAHKTAKTENKRQVCFTWV